MYLTIPGLRVKKFTEVYNKQENKKEKIIDYVKPELLVLAVVLYFIGAGLNRLRQLRISISRLFLGMWMPFSIGLCDTATCPLGTMQEIAMAVFYSYCTGDSCGGLSTYVNQLVKQGKKIE